MTSRACVRNFISTNSKLPHQGAVFNSAPQRRLPARVAASNPWFKGRAEPTGSSQFVETFVAITSTLRHIKMAYHSCPMANVVPPEV